MASISTPVMRRLILCPQRTPRTLTFKPLYCRFLSNRAPPSPSPTTTTTATTTTTIPYPPSHSQTKTPSYLQPFHSSTTPPQARERDASAPAQKHGPTGLGDFDVFGDVAAAGTAVEACLNDGFRFENGVSVDGGVLVFGGSVLGWRAWGVGEGVGEGGGMKGGEGGKGGDGMKGGCKDGKDSLLDEKGRLAVAEECFRVLGGMWPRPDLLIIGTGPQIRPLSPSLALYLAGLGIRTEVGSTRNAASLYNLLAMERGEENVAAAMVPVGWGVKGEAEGTEGDKDGDGKR